MPLARAVAIVFNILLLGVGVIGLLTQTGSRMTAGVAMLIVLLFGAPISSLLVLFRTK